MNTHAAVIKRSGGRCEAMIAVGTTYTRCFRTGVEVHHMLTRSRGGLILDAAGETAHLIALCPTHHRWAHGPSGQAAGLMINGYVTTGPDDAPLYEGSDGRLLRYRRGGSPVDLPKLREELPGNGSSEGL